MILAEFNPAQRWSLLSLVGSVLSLLLLAVSCAVITYVPLGLAPWDGKMAAGILMACIHGGVAGILALVSIGTGIASLWRSRKALYWLVPLPLILLLALIATKVLVNLTEAV
jgi:hypothetical protein